MKKLDSGKLDEILAEAFKTAENGRISVDDVVKLLPDNLEEPAAVRERIERELDANEFLFKNFENDGDYQLRSKFFNGKQFCVTPDDSEIDSGILYPGHRFCIFAHEEVFPSEITFIDEATGKEVGLRPFVSEVTSLVPFHILMGSEQIFDFFIAEDPRNSQLLDKEQPAREVILNVFDMSDFYKKYKFSSGDALLVTVKDWFNGVFSFRHLSGAERKDNDVKAWIDRFSDSMEQVINRFENYLEIPDQLRWAFFFGDTRDVFGLKSGSLDEFYRDTKRIVINFENAGHTVLALADLEEEDDFEMPEDVMISQGKTNTLKELLADIGSPLSPAELDAYMMDQCYRRDMEFDSFFSRCFAGEKLQFADDAQEAVFLNYVEDRWEQLSRNYNRHVDEPKAPLRERILEIVDARVEWLEYLQSLELETSQLPEGDMKKIAESSLYLNDILELLNSEGHTLQEGDDEDLFAAIDDIAETQEKIIEKMNQYMNL
jgi:ribosome-associated translation inhibitor RaiA